MGIHYPEYCQGAPDLGEQMEKFGDFPIFRGFTSPFSRIWINELGSRQTFLTVIRKEEYGNHHL